MRELVRHPLAWAPLGMAGVALGRVAGCAWSGACSPGPGGDEGAAARVFQLLFVSQVVTILGFALRWLPDRPRAAGGIIAVQVFLAVVPIAAIVALES